MLEKNKYLVMVTAGIFSLLVTYLHITSGWGLSPDIILEELYYIPLLLGTLLFGLRGAISTYVFVSLLYLNYLSGISKANVWVMADRLLHLFTTGLFAIIAGLLVERERRLQRQVEKEKYLSNIGRVATAIVHDLKNPLIVVSGFAKRIRDGKGNITEAAQTIIESATNMQKIVHDVLDFSKPIQMELKETDLRDIINSVVESCRIKAEEKGVMLSLEMPSDHVYIPIDSLKMQRALINLVNNAIEASAEKQRVILTVSVKKKSIMITIGDAGSGMDKETLENIFIPFFTKKTGGTGLGMAIAIKVVEGHHGNIIVDSKVGEGTQIAIELPLKGV